MCRDLVHDDVVLPPEPPTRRRWWDNIVTTHTLPQPAQDVLEQHQGEWTPAEVLALLSWLPDDSAVAASMQGGREYIGWGQDRWMRKSTYDAVQASTAVNMKIAAGKKHRSVKMPEQWPTPEQQKKKAERSRPRASVATLPTLQLPTI